MSGVKNKETFWGIYNVKPQDNKNTIQTIFSEEESIAIKNFCNLLNKEKILNHIKRSKWFIPGLENKQKGYESFKPILESIVLYANLEVLSGNIIDGGLTAYEIEVNDNYVCLNLTNYCDFKFEKSNDVLEVVECRLDLIKTIIQIPNNEN